MAAPVLCLHQRAEDDSKCVLNAHEDAVPHAYVSRLDPRLELLDELAETFRRNNLWPAYHHVRAVAHDLGFHLSGCVYGRRAVPHARPTPEEADRTHRRATRNVNAALILGAGPRHQLLEE
jgi:hypothetical protein